MIEEATLHHVLAVFARDFRQLFIEHQWLYVFRLPFRVDEGVYFLFEPGDADLGISE